MHSVTSVSVFALDPAIHRLICGGAGMRISFQHCFINAMRAGSRWPFPSGP
jgi:hypothetical protein